MQLMLSMVVIGIDYPAEMFQHMVEVRMCLKLRMWLKVEEVVEVTCRG